MVYQITRRKDDRVPDWCSGSVYVSQDEITALMDAEQEFWKLVVERYTPDVQRYAGRYSRSVSYPRPQVERNG